MRRKLIKQDAFEQIANSSVTTAEHELVEAEGVLARALGKDYLNLHCFNESTVLYETLDDTYVHAGYEIKNNQVTFNNIEELVVDTESKAKKRKGVLGEMLQAVLVDNSAKAGQLFSNYMGLYSFNEAKKLFGKEEKGGKKKGKGGPPWLNKGKDEEKGGKKGKKHHKEKFDFFKGKAKKAGKKVEEAYTIAGNVLDYVNYLSVGPALSEAVCKRDDSGNVVDLRVPSSKVRNEGHMLRFDWKTLNEKCKNLREQALALHEEEMFVKAMSDLRRQNKFNDAHGLEEVLENVVRAFPSVLYVTESELAQVIGEALRISGDENYDDQTCEFMAEGVLRKAFESFKERAAQVLHLASAPKCETNVDPYHHFQAVVSRFYPAIDEKFGLEKKMFEDLYESLEGIYKTADRRGNNELKSETASYLNELADILNGEAKPDVELAEEVATWLASLIETNLESGTWTVSNKPHITVSGDHPDMAKKASHSYAPSKDFTGDWGDELPMIGQDSMTYKGGKHSKEARSHSWGNVGGKDTFPSLSNPYVPKPFGDYTMKGEKGVDKDTFGQHHSTWQSGDTWPKLQNPYVPKAETPQSYKMNKGKEKDLVIDK